MKNTDRIERSTVLRAPLARVWKALSDHAEFGAWFRCQLDAPFVAGHRVTGRITHPGYEHLKMELWVERVDAERLLSFRWHPYAIEPTVDYSTEPTTLVELKLEPVPEGTRITVIESGFDQLPAARRDVALRMNDGGWEAQLENVRAHVAG